MNRSYLIWGTASLMLGLVILFYSFSAIGELQTFTGQLLRFFSGTYSKYYQFSILSSLFGIIFAVIGFVSIIYGAISNSNQIKNKP